MSDRIFVLKPFVNLEGDGNDPDGVMVDTHSATMCSCNATAWILLRGLKAKTSVSDLVHQLVAEFEITEQDARVDVMTFVHQLAAMGLIDESE